MATVDSFNSGHLGLTERWDGFQWQKRTSGVTDPALLNQTKKMRRVQLSNVWAVFGEGVARHAGSRTNVMKRLFLLPSLFRNLAPNQSIFSSGFPYVLRDHFNYMPIDVLKLRNVSKLETRNETKDGYETLNT